MLSQIFKAYDVRAIYPDKLNEEAAWKVGCATGQYISKLARTGMRADTLLVSRDMRPHSPSLASALIEGLRASGFQVIDLGMCDTSFMYFAINHLGAAGGIQTTASHNPVQYNGFKISGPEARPIGATTGLKEIQALAEKLGPRGSLPPKGSLSSLDLWDAYRQHVLKFLVPLPKKVKVFVDASNGMAGKMVPRIFNNVPNLEIVPVNFEITGSFVHEPNPLVAENMKPTSDGVVKHKADLGACFDGDADRCIFTDENGKIIPCDLLTALFAKYFLPKSPGAAALYDLRSSKIVEETITALGGKPHRSRVGHVFMKALLRETQGVFGGELSGHFYFRDNYYTDSGAIAFAVAVSIIGLNSRKISELISPFAIYAQSGEINFQAADKAGVIAALKAKYAGKGTIDELDGVTIDTWNNPGGGWWINVRASNTEPLLRLNAEARDKATLDKLLHEVTPMMGKLDAGHH